MLFRKKTVEYRDGLPVFNRQSCWPIPIRGWVNRHVSRVSMSIAAARLTGMAVFACRRGMADGHRLSHCRCWPEGYFIREA